MKTTEETRAFFRLPEIKSWMCAILDVEPEAIFFRASSHGFCYALTPRAYTCSCWADRAWCDSPSAVSETFQQLEAAKRYGLALIEEPATANEKILGGGSAVSTEPPGNAAASTQTTPQSAESACLVCALCPQEMPTGGFSVQLAPPHSGAPLSKVCGDCFVMHGTSRQHVDIDTRIVAVRPAQADPVDDFTAWAHPGSEGESW